MGKRFRRSRYYPDWMSDEAMEAERQRGQRRVKILVWIILAYFFGLVLLLATAALVSHLIRMALPGR